MKMPPSSSNSGRPRKLVLGRFVIICAVFLAACFNIQLWNIVQDLEEQPPTKLSQQIERQQQQQQQKFPYPVFVVGLPKVGTSSIHAMFECNEIKSSHYCCCGSNRTHTHCNNDNGSGGGGGGGRTFAECMRKNIKQNLPILQGCGDYNVYAQMDAEYGKSMFLPQRFHMDRLHSYAPNATLLLNLRPDEDWVRSVTNWFGLGGRFLRLFKVDITTGKVDRHQALLDIYNNHSAFIRNFAQSHPSHNLLELDISSPNAGKVLANAFGIQESCWGKHNVNNKKKN